MLESKVDDAEIGQEIEVAMIETAWSKQYYEHEYVQGKAATPDCYALGSKEEGLVAHPNCRSPQNKQTDGTSPCGMPGRDGSCPHNQFRTARIGKGKRCTDKPRVMVALQHDVVGKDSETIKKVSCYQLDIPAASIGNFGDYLTSLNDLTPHANFREALTRVRCQMRPGAKGHELKFEFVDLVPRQVMPWIISRGPLALQQMTQPFPDLGADGQEQKDQKPVKGQGAPKGRR